MKFITSFLLSSLLLASVASAQIKLKEVGGQLYYKLPAGSVYKPASPTVATGSSSTVVGPPGPQGTSGVTPTISVSVSTGSAGSAASVTKSGSTTAVGLSFIIPRGDPGLTPALTVGGVTTLTAGSTPTVTLSGTSGTPVLGFGFPVPGVASVSPGQVRGYFSAGTGLLYNAVDGQYYLNAADVNTIVKSYLKSRDGYAAGKVLQADGAEYTWVTPTSTTVSGGSSAPTSPGGSVVANTHIFADSTVSQVNPGVMTDVNIATTSDLLNFIATTQTNKRGILTNANTAYDNGAAGFSRTGAWTNVMLTSLTSATLVSSSSNVMTFQGSNTVNRVKLKGITFKSTNTGGGYPMLFTNELVSFDGLEIAGCVFVGTNAGNWNGFGVIQYSTTSSSGGTSANLYIHDNYFLNIPRLPIEILSQGYDAVRLTNVTITGNRFENTGANTGETNRMATSLSGLITNIYHARNRSINAKNIAYEFVNVKYAKAESNTATASLEDCVGYSVSDDGRNSTEQIYLESSSFTMTSRPFQVYDAKDVHINGITAVCGRGVDVKSRLSSYENLTITAINTHNVEAIWQWVDGSTGNTLKNATLSSWGSLAAGREPSYETVVLRSGTSTNVLSNLILRQGKRASGTYFTDGSVVNQGAGTNTVTGITVQLEP